MKLKSYSSVFIIVAMLTVSGCKKDNDDDTTPVDTVITSTEVLTDFAHILANPNYQAVHSKAALLHQAAQNLSTNTTAANLTLAQDAWRAVRVPWEQAEAYLFGPIDDFNYDPAIDTWPVNTVELDSLLASSNPLTLGYIDSLPYSLKGFHPIEYLLFGVGSSKTAGQFTAREFQYLNALTQSLLNSALALKNSWDVTLPGNFTNELITAGNGSTRYATRKDAFLEIVIAMENICNEVANGKMEDPLVQGDSTLVESQYAHNATNDFKNNIIGVQNVYLCKFTATGRSLHDLVAAKDLNLDNAIQQQINAAISALENINPDYGLAISTQHSQIIMAQFAINDLANTLNGLHGFVEIQITD